MAHAVACVVPLVAMRILYIIAIATVVLSCNRKTAPDPHTSQTALDYYGTYLGTLPRADGPGIRTVVELREDGTYRLQQLYIGDEQKPVVSEGRYEWQSDGQRITLLDAATRAPSGFFVGENRLTQLDKSGQRITGDMTSEYVLTKHPDMLLGTQWRLTQLNGQPLDSSQLNEPPTLFLDAAMVIASGSTSCNRFNGKYELGEGTLSFGPLVTTKRACRNMEVEGEYLEALSEVAEFQMDGEMLLLMGGGGRTVAEFEADGGG